MAKSGILTRGGKLDALGMDQNLWDTLAGFWGFLVGEKTLWPLFIWQKKRYCPLFLSRKKSSRPIFFLEKILLAPPFFLRKNFSFIKERLTLKSTISYDARMFHTMKSKNEYPHPAISVRIPYLDQNYDFSE